MSPNTVRTQTLSSLAFSSTLRMRLRSFLCTVCSSGTENRLCKNWKTEPIFPWDFNSLVVRFLQFSILFTRLHELRLKIFGAQLNIHIVHAVLGNVFLFFFQTICFDKTNSNLCSRVKVETSKMRSRIRN